MRYIDSTLLKDEKLIYFARPHWIVFMPALITFFAAILCWYFGPQYLPINSLIFDNWSFSEVASVGIFAFTVYWFVTAFVCFYFSEYAVTDRRIILKEGFIQRRVLELFLRRLEGINVDQTVIGRILDYGTLVVIGTGGTKDAYYNIPQPFTFRKIIQQQTDLLIDNDPTNHDA